MLGVGKTITPTVVQLVQSPRIKFQFGPKLNTKVDFTTTHILPIYLIVLRWYMGIFWASQVGQKGFPCDTGLKKKLFSSLQEFLTNISTVSICYTLVSNLKHNAH